MSYTKSPLRAISQRCWGQSQAGKEVVIADCDSPYVADGQANAVRLVLCWNSHDALVKALANAREELRLIRMKDTAVCYNPAVRLEMDLALNAAGYKE